MGVALALTLAAAAAGWFFFWRTPPPPMGTEAEVLSAVDALFTAVTARSDALLAQCTARLRELRDAGKLPAESGDYLDDIIATADAGDWEDAAQRLYRYMEAQRR
jgi:hypothetical protein